MGQAVQRDLDAIAQRDPELAQSGLAALALAMAQEIDFPNSATSKSMCAGQLRDALAGLRALTPVAEVHDEIDDLRRRRAERTAARQSNP